MTRRETPLDAGEILRALARAEVEHVIIGGLAAQAHGHTRTTQDVNLFVADEAANLDRLAVALAALGARDGNGGRPTGESLAARAVTSLDSDAGGVDVHRHPPGADDFAAVRRRALELDVAGARVAVAGLDDLIAMKRASRRPIDRLDIAVLTSDEAGEGK